MGYLPQESVFESVRTLWEESLIPFANLRKQEVELTRLATEMGADDPAEATSAMEAYGNLQLRFEHAGGYTYEATIKQVLSGLGFRDDEYSMPLVHLSGGQRTRALLARLLLEAPTLLILDEPTNHLDINAVEWLENYLKDWDGAALIVLGVVVALFSQLGAITLVFILALGIAYAGIYLIIVGIIGRQVFITN